MNKEKLRSDLYRLTVEYNNGLDYIRNNPFITAAEVQEHYKIIKERFTVMKMLKKSKN